MVCWLNLGLIRDLNVNSVRVIWKSLYSVDSLILRDGWISAFWLLRYGGNFCALREWVVWRWKRSKKCLLKESVNEAYPWGENDYLKAKDALNKYLGRKQMFRTKGFVFAKWVVWQTTLWNRSWRDWGRKLKSVNFEMLLVWMRKFATGLSQSVCHTTFAASLSNRQLQKLRELGIFWETGLQDSRCS